MAPMKRRAKRNEATISVKRRIEIVTQKVQGVGDHRGQQLQSDGIVVVAEELADLEMLLDPAEEQLDIP